MIFYAVTSKNNKQNRSDGVFYIPESARSYGVYTYLIEYCDAGEGDANEASEWCVEAEIGEVFISNAFTIKIVDDDRYDDT